ncbi:MAG: protocatechuate 3,4-dioxygenase subunit beta [Sporichthyaceae bacterium]|nr:protocatechuate 3,4-dioxygenase subunit beta [Sporichthyaceae bacterium]
MSTIVRIAHTVIERRPRTEEAGMPEPVVPGYRRDSGDVHPPLDWPDYGSTALRAPNRAPVPLPHTFTELTGPLLGSDRIRPFDHDLTRQHTGEPMGERIIVHGRVLDGDGRAVPDTLIEVWQANAAGRYAHSGDRHPAPLDPNFTGVGRCLTAADGSYQFVTVKPGAYPWRNHHNAWRPAHIHFSLFGRAFVQRLVTQMYFPGDPLFGQDPIFNSVPEPARQRMVADFDLSRTEPEWALAYQFDIVLQGRDAIPMEEQ